MQGSTLVTIAWRRYRLRKRKHSTIFLERTRERPIVNQTNIATVSRAILGKLLRDGVERSWAFPSA